MSHTSEFNPLSATFFQKMKIFIMHPYLDAWEVFYGTASGRYCTRNISISKQDATSIWPGAENEIVVSSHFIGPIYQNKVNVYCHLLASWYNTVSVE